MGVLPQTTQAAGRHQVSSWQIEKRQSSDSLDTLTIRNEDTAMKTTTTQSRNLVRGAILLLVLTGWFTAPRLFRQWAEPTALAAPMTFVVNTAADADDGLCSPAPSGCTLREAINAANANSGADTINFDIPGGGVKTIQLTSNLPNITGPVTIDGYTQGVATPNTLAVGDNAVLLVELDVSAVSDAGCCVASGLRIFGGNSTVKGLVINRFNAVGIQLSGGGNNVIEGNFIGTDPGGAIPLGLNSGILISSSNNTVGGTTPAARNVLSGNTFGLQIAGNGANGNQVQNNYIGTDRSGNSPLGNTVDGVLILAASNNVLGGTLATSANLIAFNGSIGIALNQSGTGNAILGNSIHSNIGLGIDLHGDGVTPNDTGDSDTGANNLQNFPVLTSASSAAANTTIHGTLNSTPGTQFRVEIFSSPSCDDSGNGEGKKLIDSGNLMTNASGDLGFASVVPNASLDGPYITATATDPLNNTSEFSKCIPALASTLVVNSTADTDDGFCTSSAGGCTLREAINAANTNSLLNAINFNIPGSGVRTISPTSALPDITGPVIIDGYTQLGAKPNTLVDGNDAVLLIELNGAGAGPVDGLVVKGGSCVVRGLAINRFSSAGIVVKNNGDNVIAGNFIGTDPTGTTDLGNFNGVGLFNQPGNRVGGQLPADRNVVSGSEIGAGIFIQNAMNNVIQGNYVGTNAAGTAPIGNFHGLHIDGSFLNTIGGNSVGARNLLSGNNVGVHLNTAHDNIVRGNFIGTDLTGTNGLGNSGAGVSIGPLQTSSGNIIGGFGLDDGNVIAFNGGDGVTVNLGIENAILGNSIHSNGGLGIDLAPDGVTANDANDGDSGVNNLQNFPILNLATANAGKVTVQGTLDSTPNTQFKVQLFSNSSCDPSGHGEGEKLVGLFKTTTVTTDSGGNANFTISLNASAGGKFITATATDPDGNTSEFSPCIQAPFTSTFQFGLPTYSVLEDCTEVIVNVSRVGDTSTEASVDYSSQSGTASDRTDFTTALGTLHFAPGETAMSFTVLVSEDSFVEGTETATLALSNPVGAGLGTQATATLEITDDQPEQTNNPLDVAEQFVCQHYQDFLNREHDVAGLNFWTNEIESCGADLQCREVKRINVSAAFFLSIEFQETGGDVIRTQRAAFGNKSDTAASRLTYLQFLRDARQVGKGVVVGEPGWQQKLENNKQAYAEQVVTSVQFVAQYPLNQNADTFVDALFASAGVVPSATERQDAINAFGAGATAGRTAALRKVTDSQTLRAAEFRPAFVLMQYYGYLRRNPTDPPDNNDNGYQFWLAKLNAFNGDFAQAEMVKAFIVSTEYRSRFGQP
jgi:CSLREA domain-containing protein